jgi:hypothetical protein
MKKWREELRPQRGGGNTSHRKRHRLAGRGTPSSRRVFGASSISVPLEIILVELVSEGSDADRKHLRGVRPVPFALFQRVKNVLLLDFAQSEELSVLSRR